MNSNGLRALHTLRRWWKGTGRFIGMSVPTIRVSGVAVSDRPEGPYKDALGKPLLTVSDCFASQKQWALHRPYGFD